MKLQFYKDSGNYYQEDGICQLCVPGIAFFLQYSPNKISVSVNKKAQKKKGERKISIKKIGDGWYYTLGHKNLQYSTDWYYLPNINRGYLGKHLNRLGLNKLHLSIKAI